MNQLDHALRCKAVWGSRISVGRRKATWGFRLSIIAFACALGLAANASASTSRRFPKLDRELESRAVTGSSRRSTTVIVTLAPGADVPASLRKYSRFGRLNGLGAHVLDIPDSELQNVATLPQAIHVHPDGTVRGLDFRTNVTSGSFFVNHNIGLDGAGVAVAVLDSGIASQHDDLSSRAVVYFKDFVNNKPTRYDDLGHGTHVAGIISGSGKDSNGQEAGVAPGAKLVVLKVLDANGVGTISNVIAALDWLAAYGPSLGVRVVNLSFGAKPTDAPDQDPLALAAKVLVDRGIVVVAAAGNNGEYNGKKVWGGIPSPADAPWVITVGASSTLGTVTRKDDRMASFSSRGPAVGRIAKPDLVASGVGTVSTISPEGTLYALDSQFLINAPCLLNLQPCPTTTHTPYMSMSGTSMAAPVVAGTVALMLEANPNLTPNLVKAILQYTAEVHAGYTALEQGAGFLNALGAVRLAKFYASGRPNAELPYSPAWSRHVIWGSHRLGGAALSPSSRLWKNGVVWGADSGSDNIVWGTTSDDNIVWGTDCGGADCADNIVWGTDDGDNIVWGTDDGDNIVWGTDDSDNIIWGTDDAGDNIVWGTDDANDNIVWGTDDGDNIVWGTNFSLPAITIKFPKNPGFGWFKNWRHDQQWVVNEFGDGFIIAPSANSKTGGR